MDRMIYVGLSGAKQAMEQQAATAHNIANVSTTGFRAQINSFRAVPVVGEETRTRASVVATSAGADFTSGPLMQTGRPLDVAINGEGWLAVQGADGREAYTRNGSLQVGAEGQLMTSDGRGVLGDAGAIVVPPGSALSISADGVITAYVDAGATTGGAEVGRLKLVNPPQATLLRGDDGLFRLAQGVAPPAPEVRVQGGALEGSNVNPVEAMVEMISNARRFEMQMKTLQTAEANDQQANKLLSLN
jgi:flagellar basal-body rod protein FlgF